MAEHSREEMMATQQRMLAIFPSVRARLEAIPGVVEVGIGIKETDAHPTGEPAFGVYVREKLPLEEIPPEEVIPDEIEGFPTDVRIFRPMKKEEDKAKYRPLKAGVQIERAGTNAWGTIGCLGHRDVPGGAAILLTAGHVVGLAQDDSPAGLTGSDAGGVELGQPCHTDSWCCKCNDIAFTLHAVNHKKLDFAIAQLKPGVMTLSEIHEIGPITAIAEPMMGEAVKKRGRTTGLTTGNISMLMMNAAGTAVETIEVKKNGGNERFSMPGDSGAALLNNANAIIGLHHEGDNGEEISAPNFRSRSTRIQVVLDLLAAHGFAINIAAGGGGEDELDLAVSAARTDLMWAAELRLRQTERGRLLWSIIDLHQREVLHLVNHERAVTVAWQRNQGPAFIAALGRSLKEPIYRIPRELNGVTRERLLIAIATMLDAHGSESLRATLEQHRALLQEILIAGATAEEMFQMWEAAATPAVSE